MSVQKIGIGAAPNDGTGDPLRTAFDKVNDNLDWMTDKIGTDDEVITLSGNIGKRYLDMTATDEVYNDINFNISTLNPVGVGSPATIVVTSGQSGIDYALRYTVNNTLYAVVQLPHYWIPGTRVYPHIHVQPQTANINAVSWAGWYSIADIGGVFPAPTAIGVFATGIAAGNQWKHLLLPMPPGGIDMTGFTGPSAIIRLKFEVAAVSETFDVIGFDVHYRWGGSPVVYSP